MTELGLFKKADDLKKASEPKPDPASEAEARERRNAKAKARAEKAALSPSVPSRASGRLRNKPAPVYRDYDVYLDDLDFSKRSTKRKRGGSGAGGRGGRSPWDNTAWPHGDAAREAAERAQECMDKLKNPSFCKIMLPSMVAGGFWMEAPQGIPAHMPPGPLASKHPFLLVRPPKLAITAEEDVDASSIAMDDDADEWRVVWLIRKGDGKWSGGGFSGGWRGCAIDLKLAVGDAIVFEVLPGRRDGLLALQMRVFRARDPATIRPTWEALEEMMNDDQDANNAAEERREKVSSTATATATAFEYSAKAIDSRGGKPNARRQSEGERLLLNSGVVALHSSSEEEDEEERPKKKQKRMRAPVAPTQRAKLPSAPSAGAKAGVKAWGPAMIGARVEKEFDGEMYAGEVTSYDPTEDWYKVVYEDGDREEIDVTELNAILKAR